MTRTSFLFYAYGNPSCKFFCSILKIGKWFTKSQEKNTMFLLFLLLAFGFVVFLGIMGNLCKKLNLAPSPRLFFYFIGWYIGAAALLIDIVCNRASCSLRIILIGLLAPIVIYEILRLLRRFLSWSFNGLGHYK